MKARKIGYWVCTAFVAFSFVTSGFGYVLRIEQPLQGVMELGFPLHFVVLLGVWKILGGTVVLLPRTPLLKEWAYAGIVFDLTGAAVAHAATAHGARFIIIPLVITGLAVASWWLRPESRRLPGAVPVRSYHAADPAWRVEDQTATRA